MTVFLLAHLAFVVLGLVALQRVPLALFAASQLVFVGYFAGVLPLAVTQLDPLLFALAIIRMSRASQLRSSAA